jgi:hypothetical protein
MTLTYNTNGHRYHFESITEAIEWCQWALASTDNCATWTLRKLAVQILQEIGAEECAKHHIDLQAVLHG